MRPIFILGNSRSGTTLLRLMLTCHENISIPPEGPFYFFLEPKFHNIEEFNRKVIEDFIFELLSVPKMDEWNLDNNKLYARLSNSRLNTFIDLINGVHEEYMSNVGQIKKRWGDKSGSYSIRYINSIRRSLPNAHLINIIRDGRDVACSYRALHGVKGKYAPNLPTNIMEIALQWKLNVSRIHEFLDNWPKEQRTELKYEDLVSNPKSTLLKLCGDIDEEFDANMLDFHKENAKLHLEPKIYLNWKQKTMEAVSNSQVGRWKSELSETDVRLFEFVAGDTLHIYDYAIEKKNNQFSISDSIRITNFIIRKNLQRSGRYVKSVIKNNH